MKFYLTVCLAFLCSISSAEDPEKSSDSYHRPSHPAAQHFNGDQPQVYLQGQPSQKDQLNARAFNNQHGQHNQGQHGQHNQGQHGQHNQGQHGQHNQGQHGQHNQGQHGQHNRNNHGGRRNQGGPHMIPGHRVSPNGFGGHPMGPGCAGNPKALAQLIANYVVQFQQQQARDKNKKKGQPNNKKGHKKHPELHPSQSENEENAVPQGFDFHDFHHHDRSDATEDKPVIRSSQPDDD